MDFWKGAFLRKHVALAAFESAEGLTELECHDRVANGADPEELDGMLTVFMDDGAAIDYPANFYDYMQFEAAGFSTEFYTGQIRQTPMPLPFGKPG